MIYSIYNLDTSCTLPLKASFNDPKLRGYCFKLSYKYVAVEIFIVTRFNVTPKRSSLYLLLGLANLTAHIREQFLLIFSFHSCSNELDSVPLYLLLR